MTEGAPHSAWLLAALTAHERPLLRFAATYVGPDAARDVVQDSFLELCRTPREDVEDHLAPWLFTVCRNRALTLRRAQGREAPEEDSHTMESTELGPHGALEKKEAGAAITALLDGLSERHREIVALKFQGGLSYKEIAEVTGLTVSHVGVILHEAIGRVRASMAKREGTVASGTVVSGTGRRTA